MGLPTPWIQFITWLAVALVAYGVFLVGWLYPNLIRKLLSGRKSNTGASGKQYKTYSPDNIMGPVRVSTYVPRPKTQSLDHSSTPSTLVATHHSPTVEPGVTQNDEEKTFTFALASAEEHDFSDGNGLVDLDRLTEVIDDAASLIENHSHEVDTELALSAKSQLMAVIAADDFLTSTDFARQLATTLDTEVPTDAFSGIDTLQSIAA